MSSCISTRGVTFADSFWTTGGQKILVKSAGQDATEQFHRFHSASVLQNQAAPFRIGSIGADASTKDADDHEEDEDTTYFGDLVP